MDPLQFLLALRRRWPIVAAAVVLGIAVGWLLTRPGAPADPLANSEALPTQFRSTVYLLKTEEGLPVGVPSIRTLITLGELPQRVAEELGYSDPSEATSGVTTDSDSDAGLITISVTRLDAEEAERLADTVTDQLLAWLAEQPDRDARAEVARLEAALQPLEAELFALDDSIAATTGVEQDLLRAERDAKLSEIQALRARLETLRSRAPASPGLRVFDRRTSVEVPSLEETTGIVPASRPIRVGLAAGIALLLGLAVALVVDQFDTRIRTRRQAERRFGLPVLAEVPSLSKRELARTPESFHLLSASLLHHLRRRPPDGLASGQVVLVTSPRSGAGRTLTVRHLAGSLAELGQRVLVVACDLRDPTLHKHFSITNDDGLVDGLAAGNGAQVLDGRVKTVPRVSVRVVTSGSSTRSPVRLLASDRMMRAIAEARQQADIVLLDSPGLLEASDAAFLVPLADVVLVVARARHVTGPEARRTADILGSLGAEHAAVVLNDVAGGAGAQDDTDGPQDPPSWTRGEPHLVRPYADAYRAK